MSKIILTGDRTDRTSSRWHYVGSLKERVKLQNSGEYDEIYIMIADAQALTDKCRTSEKVMSEYYERSIGLSGMRNRS